MHKQSNPWVFRGIYFPLSNISRENWFTTGFNTNVAESAHALSQRYGKHLSLVGAVTACERIDKQFFEMRRNVLNFGLSIGYAKSTPARTQTNLKRQKSGGSKQMPATKI